MFIFKIGKINLSLLDRLGNRVNRIGFGLTHLGEFGLENIRVKAGSIGFGPISGWVSTGSSL